MHPAVVASLRCPICRGPLATSGAALRCGSGHAFDVARQGYVSFLAGKGTGLLGDDARMVDARARFLGAGHYDPLSDALAALAAGAGPGLVVEVGAGTGRHLARVLDALPAHAGLAVDLSKHASRRAARAHPRAGAIAADARSALPVADACASVVLDVFAPRNAAELRRILRPDGLLVVATPEPEHLGELRAPLGLLDVDPEKRRRVDDALAPLFERGASRALGWRMALGRADVVALASMGPSARHVDDATLAERAAALPDPALVTAAVTVVAWTPRAETPAPPSARADGSPAR
ncbi:putative RNA methyltransferase [Anaeromyxobacter oryzae]|uniref:Ubiquinone biosynthesis protein n=1 Tax=Anaeromyxobacter oryzae TaxID=2918170 RepID=A0ABM7WQK3_9BACT|nr:methyltransferase domain-containing protein [Anaeromyxobacter oryzae]BDG01739.1 ubiquinone biosynthesis protein [Anaeromyxobacter oryzae]